MLHKFLLAMAQIEPPVILTLSSIKEYLKSADLIPLIEQGFISLSREQAVVPPVGELLFEKPPGDVHIKYGYIKEQSYYVIKVASGFYNNPKIGLSSSQGLMLLFSQQTGAIVSILLDEGHLTDVRTVIASMITLKYLAPSKIEAVGIVGTGMQAKLQLKYLHQVSDCKNIVVWGRSKESTEQFKKEFSDSSYSIRTASTTHELAQECNVIITTTPSVKPLLEQKDIRKGTHITSLGSDTPDKIELSPSIIQQADIVVSDSISQSFSRGEVYQVRKQTNADLAYVIELGDLIQTPSLGRTNDNQITVADLTGVAVQDIMIATSIFNQHKKQQHERSHF